jgi:hypothetical protein
MGGQFSLGLGLELEMVTLDGHLCFATFNSLASSSA